MVTHPAHQATRTSRDLAARIDRVISEFRTEHPKATDADVSMALQSALQHVPGTRGLSPAQAIALGLGLSLVMGAIGLAAKVATSGGGDVLGLLIASFVVASLAVVFIAARHNG